jgi:hypothetical protein
MPKKILFIIFLFIFAPPIIAGNDITITCSASSCTKSSELPLFNELNLAPNFSRSQTLKVINNRPDNCNLLFKLNSDSPKNLLSSVETISIVADNNVWYAGSLSDLYNDKTHQLGNIDTNQYKNYLWTVSINQSAGNDYQLQNNNFDIDFNFTCGDNNSTPDSICHDTVPTQIPQNLKAISGQNSVTLFWDEPTDSFTYYLIAYSENSDAATFANPNIGGKGTQTYTINNLSADTTYYFKIRTGNGCASGSFSTIVSTTPKGKVLIKSSSVLGAQNSLPDTTGSVKGASCLNIFPYAFILALLINLILYRYLLITFLITVLSFSFDYYLSKFTCQIFPYFYLTNLLSFLLPLLLHLKNSHKKLY